MTSPRRRASPSSKRQFETVRVQVVVLLADEDDVGPRDVGEQGVEIDELARRASQTRGTGACTRPGRRPQPTRSARGRRPRSRRRQAVVISRTSECSCTGSRFRPDADVDHLDEHREAHREVDVALRDVLAEPVGHQRHADQQQERQRQDLDRRVRLDDAR